MFTLNTQDQPQTLAHTTHSHALYIYACVCIYIYMCKYMYLRTSMCVLCIYLPWTRRIYRKLRRTRLTPMRSMLLSVWLLSVSEYACAHTHAHTNMHRVYIYIYACMCVYTFIYIYIHVRMCEYICIQYTYLWCRHTYHAHIYHMYRYVYT